jgi:site-specific recombinase XerD
VPGRALLVPGDLPKDVRRVPRFIPEDELARLMEAIRQLDCPAQRAALLVARWCGARRSEIQRLELDCLDRYPDGTARLRIPAGKTREERVVPLNEEAAEAIRALQAERRTHLDRGLPDELTGAETRHLFVRLGQLMSTTHLFDKSLDIVCRRAGLVDGRGRPTVSAHRFRHTVGTELAEKGARMDTMMSVLGHKSPNMSLVYARVSDRTVREEYEAVLGSGAVVAGQLADALHTNELPQHEVEWLKNNFFETELELGRCLRLPQEGPCECDLYLNCAKFVTTSDYAPRLRARRLRELELIGDAVRKGWKREAERHRCAAKRVE